MGGENLPCSLPMRIMLQVDVLLLGWIDVAHGLQEKVLRLLHTVARIIDQPVLIDG